MFQQQPDGEKRATQILVQNAPYRVTIDEDTALPEVGVTAYAPSPGQAVRLAGATKAALVSYLNDIETSSGIPPAQRLAASSLGPVFVSDDSGKDLLNVAVLTFLVSLTLWSGLVLAVTAVLRDISSGRRRWARERASVGGGGPLDLNQERFSHGPTLTTRLGIVRSKWNWHKY